MKYIERARIWRTIQRLASERGYTGDMLAYRDEIPTCAPTLEQQHEIINLRIDARPRRCSEAGKRLIDRLSRAVVLCGSTSPSPPPSPRIEPQRVKATSTKARAW